MQYKKKTDGYNQKKNEVEQAYAKPSHSRGGRGRGGGERSERPQTAKPERGGHKQVEETKGGQRPQTRGGNREDYGPRGGRGGRGAGQMLQGAGTGGRGGRPLDPNSWQYKYKFGERPVHEAVEVTDKADIPELPADSDIKKKPSKDVFDKKMRELDRKAEELKITIEDNRYKKRQVWEGGKVEGSNVTYRDLK